MIMIKDDKHLAIVMIGQIKVHISYIDVIVRCVCVQLTLSHLFPALFCKYVNELLDVFVFEGRGAKRK